MDQVNIQKRTDEIGRKQVVFEVTLANNDLAFMRVDTTPQNNDKRSVVIVNAKKFLSLWQADPYGHQKEPSFGIVESWMNDRKYSDAAAGFAEGVENPVPLANVVCYSQEIETVIKKRTLFFFEKIVRGEKKIIDFASITNGVTRTIWLLANGAQSFPVECNIEEATLLHRLAGEVGSALLTVEELYA